MRHDAIAAAVIAAALLPFSARAQGECPEGTARQGDVCLPIAEASAVAGYPAAPPVSALSPAVASAFVPVRFELDAAGESYAVSVDGAPACSAPCVLMLTPGKHQAHFSGSRVASKQLKIPDGPAVVRPRFRSSLGTGLGVAGTVVGGAAAIGGYIYAIAGTAQAADGSRGKYAPEAHAVLGVGAMAVGVGTAVASAISGFVRNRTRIPVELDDGRTASSGPQLVGLSALPTREGGVVLGAAFEF